jgi:hypothetical protein
MNKRKLQEFSTWAKKNLEKQIELSLKKIGINSDNDIKPSKVQGEVTIIEGIETSFKKKFNDQRTEIIKFIKNDGYSHTVEQFASTWFNRIVALRFLEVHNYLEHGYKLFPDKPNTLPEILSKLSLIKDDLSFDTIYVQELTSSANNNEELYRYVIFQQCNALSKTLPMLFSSDMSYLEYFIPTPLLFGETIINKIIEIDQSDFKDDVEIIGWLYQFYIATKKDEVFASKKTITKDTLPAVTQLFTPDWIVKYMVENSIGRIWMESYPKSQLKSELMYYVEEKKQQSEVTEIIESIRYKNVEPQKIKIIEPCSGSGHILVYCFDILLKMYQEKGYNKKDIPNLILNNNLVGLDIDQRATQLASFALIMRARSIDNDFFKDTRFVMPKVFEIIDSKSVITCSYNNKNYKEIILEYNSNYWHGGSRLSNKEIQDINYLLDLFEDAKIIGSLLKVKNSNYLDIQKKLEKNIKENKNLDIFSQAFFENEFKDLLQILNIAHFMVINYDVMITNPPYCGISSLEAKPKKYFIDNYPNSKTDMFAMFMETNFIKQNGYLSMINMHSWMFLNSYEELRKRIINNSAIICALHFGAHAFDSIGGEVVQTVSFVIRNLSLNFVGTYSKLVDYRTSSDKQKNFNKNLYFAPIRLYSYFPTNQLIYWSTKRVAEIFSSYPKLGNFGLPKSGIMTGNDQLFIRYWFEVSSTNSSLFNNNLSLLDVKTNLKWFPITRGGPYRKWYGNLSYVVNMQNNGHDISHLKNNNFRLRDPKYYFKKCATWTGISSNDLSVRFVTENVLYGSGGPTFFPNNNLFYIIGLLNSNVANYFTKMLNPTINTIIDDIVSIPFIEKNINFIENIVKDCIEISKYNWDETETSWNFKKHPLIGTGKISKIFLNYNELSKSNFAKLKKNEEDINEHFIRLYDLNDVLVKDVDDKYISVSIASETEMIKSLISYFVGVLMGRYSFLEEGLIYSGGVLNVSKSSDFEKENDAIIPIYSDLNVKDGLVHRLLGIIKKVYGLENYRENIDYIAETLGKKSNETNEETINRYLNEDFYKDHLKVYSKRPIYWMFSSGKSDGFKCLIYMHRYNKDTLAKINAGYFQPATTILRNQIKELDSKILAASNIEKRTLEKKRLVLIEQLNEALDYGQVLDYMANKYLQIDLDDGVKVNYYKFQGIEITTSKGKVKIDLLSPLK